MMQRKACPLLVQTETNLSCTISGVSLTKTYFDDNPQNADATDLEQQLAAALDQLHRYAPCKVCVHRDRSAPDHCGCLIGGKYAVPMTSLARYMS